METSYRVAALARINKETEKALNVTLYVTWSANSPERERDFWLPKSVVEGFGKTTDAEGNVISEQGCIYIKDWFANKLERDNAYKGYAMKIG